MGLFARALAGQPTEQRNWLTDDDWMWSGGATASGATVTRESALRISTVYRCVNLLADVISTLPKDIVVSIGSGRFVEERDRPFWLTYPYPADPTITADEHFSQVVVSLALDGNAYVLAPNGVDYADALLVLDPRQVEVTRGRGMVPVYTLLNDRGQRTGEVGPHEMLHITRLRLPGQMKGLSVLEQARQAFGLGITAEEYGARYFGQGTTLSYGVEVPGAMTDAQREDLRANLKQRHAGTKNAHQVAVLTNAAKFVTGLGVTNEQAQFLELRKFTVEDIARWFGVPPHLVGSQEPGSSSYDSVDKTSLNFGKFNISPFVSRIEGQYNRLVKVPDNIGAPNATASFHMDLRGLERADIKTRYESYQLGVMNGFLKPNEPRAWEDLPPLPGGDKTYMQQQMVPLGSTAGTAVTGAA